MPFDDDQEQTDEAPFESAGEKDIFGNLTEVENQGGGFSDVEEGRVEPESLRPPPPEAAAESAPPAAPRVDDTVPMHVVQEERRLRHQIMQENQALREMATRFDERMRLAHEQEQA